MRVRGDLPMHRRNSLIPLALLSEGCEGAVVEITGGRGVARRLSELGFNPDVRVKVISSHFPGPVVVSVRGSRIGLGRGVAMKILVKPLK